MKPIALLLSLMTYSYQVRVHVTEHCKFKLKERVKEKLKERRYNWLLVHMNTIHVEISACSIHRDSRHITLQKWTHNGEVIFVHQFRVRNKSKLISTWFNFCDLH